MPISWREQMSIGNEIIDDDHKRLIGIINQYEAALEQMDVVLVDKVYKELRAYTQQHFEREVNLQRAVHYPYHRQHEDQHRRLIDQLEQIHHVFMTTGHETAVRDQTRELLRHWILHHLLEEDLKLRPYLMGGRGRQG